MKYAYEVNGRDEIVNGYEFESGLTNEDIKYLAENAAEDYWLFHGGWESDWPIVFSIFENGELIGKAEVSMEMSPRFRAVEDE